MSAISPLTPEQQARFEQIKAAGKLPSPKGPALAVMQLTRRENVSYAQLAGAVKADSALVARLIKLANACRPAGGRPLLAVQDAISVLGLVAVRGLALGFALLEDHRTGKCAGFDYPGFWSKNLARASALQALADIARIMPRDDAFTLGLLASMGELGLASAFPAEYAKLLEAWPGDGQTRLEEEARAFGIDHADLTAAMLEDWAFPEALIEPVRCLDKPALAGFPAGSRQERIHLALELATQIAAICVASETGRRGLMADFLLLGGKLGITPEVLTDLADRLVREWQDWCRLLSVQANRMPPFVDLMKASAAPAIADFEGVPAAPDNGRLRVLIVDDERSMRSLLRALLEHIGHDCLEAENGQIGLELALKHHPHMIIADWTMPEMDGIEMTRRLRETEIGRSVYIMILTVADQEDKLIQAFAAGADDFLAKPLKPKVLAARLRAGQRVINLVREIEQDQASLKRIAAEFASLNQHLQESRRIDPLTGLVGRLPATEWLRKVIDQAGDAESLGILLIRIDNLGTINRRYGRLMGDQVLQQATKRIQALLQPQEKLARYADACFMLVCAGTNESHLQALTHRIGQGLEAPMVEAGGQPLTLTLHMGHALWNRQTASMDDLLNRAEAALQRSS